LTACYFNSLIQILFFLPNIQEKILNFNLEGLWQDMKDIEEVKQLGEADKIRICKSRALVLSLQGLFSRMIYSKQKY